MQLRRLLAAPWGLGVEEEVGVQEPRQEKQEALSQASVASWKWDIQDES